MGIYSYNILKPLLNLYVKNSSVIRRLDTPKNTPTQPNSPRGDTIITKRDKRDLIRNQASRIKELEVENVFLKARLKITNKAPENT